ncbi:MAG: radical SAM family heme chaperone HemW [Candidatus Nanopelagicales bacterium]
MVTQNGVGTPPALRFYVHVPYCGTRCGYCDFNTYVPGEAGRGGTGDWREAAIREVRLARQTLGADPRPVSSVFFGGGTPTLLPATDLAAVLAEIADEFGLAPAAEVTCEANPETITPALLDALLAGGMTRLSLGMQSADAGVLRVLDRQHSPGGAVKAARLAQLAGFPRVSLDLIYATPGETLESWRATVETAVEAGVGHVSAYALTVEPGTVLARKVGRGEMAAPDDDHAAACYEIADSALGDAGLPWYEISNWAIPGHECGHNVGYWTADDWWGVGPGAHSHAAGVRWWNLRHPVKWAAALTAGQDPREGEETLSADQRRTEQVMLAVRLAAGFEADVLVGANGPAIARDLAGRGLLEAVGPRWRLTRRGRLLADAVTLELLAAASAHDAE